MLRNVYGERIKCDIAVSLEPGLNRTTDVCVNNGF